MRKKSNNGFTLIELLVSITILLMISIVVSTILIAALRGSKKSNVVTLTYQNGGYAMTLMTQMIRDSQSFNGIGTYDSIHNTVSVSQNNCSGAQYPAVQITDPDSGITTFVCNQTDSNQHSNIASNSAVTTSSLGTANYLLNTNTVSLNNCSFTCAQNGGNPPVISINFTLNKLAGNSTFGESNATLPFSTSVTLRNNN